MKVYYSFCFFILLNCFSVPIYSQGLNNLWLLGYDSIWQGHTGRTLIDFSTGAANINWMIWPMDMAKANSSISDQNGNLLFYTNGIYVANAFHDTMLNGEDLNPSSYTTTYSENGLFIVQADVIIPDPVNPNRYYLFHCTIDDACSICRAYYIYYSIIDMSLDNGKGAVISKNNVILNSSLIPGHLIASKHANGRDWWVISHQYNTNRFYKFLITPFGISTFTQDIGSIRTTVGQSVFSQNGKQFAIYDFQDDLDLMDFDRCTGDFSNLMHISINDSAACAGVSFSPDSRVLYLSSMDYLYQFDLTATNIPASQQTIAVYDGFYSPTPLFETKFYVAQLAADQKIYINTPNGTDYLHVINYPDSIGAACGVCQHCIQLPTYNAASIPNYPNYFLGSDSTTLCDTITDIPSVIEVFQELNLFPNPVKDRLYLTSQQLETNSAVKIYDLYGQIIECTTTKINRQYLEINTTTLLPGVYFLEFHQDLNRIVRRFVKR